jgi:WD repeat and SOF domain-containing protein 1
MRVNQLVFNPLQPPILLCASEDHNLYTFDMRNLSTTTQVYKGHVGACVFLSAWPRTIAEPFLLAVSCLPTGRRRVASSCRAATTVRFVSGKQGKARHGIPTTRSVCSGTCSLALSSTLSDARALLASVFSTLYTLDSRFVLSGSDDSNLRIWKARAGDKLGVVDKREMARKEYRDGLREKWGSVGEVAKLERYICFFSLSAVLSLC